MFSRAYIISFLASHRICRLISNTMPPFYATFQPSNFQVIPNGCPSKLLVCVIKTICPFQVQIIGWAKTSNGCKGDKNCTRLILFGNLSKLYANNSIWKTISIFKYAYTVLSVLNTYYSILSVKYITNI